MKNTYLKHHGILGQKWGVRRYQNPDGTLTEAGRKRYLNPDGSFNKKGIKATSKVNDRVTIIPKGQVLYRTTANQYELTDGNKYVTFFEQDRNFYRAGGADWIAWTQKKNKNDLYEKQYEVTKDIKIPSKDVMKEVVLEELAKQGKNTVDAGKAYAEMYLSNWGGPDYSKDISKKVSNKYTSIEKGEEYVKKYDELYFHYSKKMDEINMELANEVIKNDGKVSLDKIEKLSKDYDKYAKSKSHYDQVWAYMNNAVSNSKLVSDSSKSSDDRLLAYMQGFGSDTGSKLKKQVIDNLKSKGYNAMTDEAGVGGARGLNRETRQALIIFDGSDVMKERSTTSFKDFTQKDQSDRRVSYQIWYNKNKGKKSLGDNDG